MCRFRLWTVAVATLTAALSTSTSQAYWHLWEISEVFSNADGSVQFIELFTNTDGEHRAVSFGVPQWLRTDSNSYMFNQDLPSPFTANKRVLVATAGFESLPGLPSDESLVPDYIIPANFFNPATDTIRLCAAGPCTPTGGSTWDARVITNLPTDGMTSWHYPFPAPPITTPGTEGPNSPQNFAGVTGMLDLSSPPEGNGDYNGDGRVDAGDYVRWRNHLGDADETELNFNGDGGDVALSDYLYWKERYGDIIEEEGGGGIASPEPATLSMALVAILWLGARLRRRWC